MFYEIIFLQHFAAAKPIAQRIITIAPKNIIFFLILFWRMVVNGPKRGARICPKTYTRITPKEAPWFCRKMGPRFCRKMGTRFWPKTDAEFCATVGPRFSHPLRVAVFRVVPRVPIVFVFGSVQNVSPSIKNGDPVFGSKAIPNPVQKGVPQKNQKGVPRFCQNGVPFFCKKGVTFFATKWLLHRPSADHGARPNLPCAKHG